MNLNKFTSSGRFLMLALDHRGSFKKLISPKDPDSVSDKHIISLKNDIIEVLKDQFSALLIDETWGLKACHEVCRIKPYLLPLEKSGDTDQAGEKITQLEYSVSHIKKMGASGAKLLIYFNPNVESADKQLETAKGVMEECKALDFPYFLEIVTYGGTSVKASVEKFIERAVVPSVWKLEYPGDLDACLEITNLAGNTPWILLTGGQHFDEFRPQLKTAISGGAKGFLAGRALWQEVCTLEGEEKQRFLNQTLPDRFRILAEIANG